MSATIDHGTYVQVTRGKHKGRRGVVISYPYGRFGKRLSSLNVRDDQGNVVWHSVNVLEPIGPLCRRCNQPLDHDGYGDPVGDAHYACAVNEREMWSR